MRGKGKGRGKGPKRGYLVDIFTINHLSYALQHFPERTPKRWDLISRYVAEKEVASSGSSPTPKFPIGEACASSELSEFISTPDSCKELAHLLEQLHPAMLTLHENLTEPFFKDGEKNAFKPIVLVPHHSQCVKCKDILRLKNQSFPLIYTTTGCLVGILFSGYCNKCHATYYPSYCITSKDDNQRFFFDPDDCTYFHISRNTVFEKALLSDINNNILYSHASFESRADVYNANFREKNNEHLKHFEEHFKRQRREQTRDFWKLTAERLEEVWFMWEIVSFYKEIGDLENTNLMTDSDYLQPGHRRDIDRLCSDAMEVIFKQENRAIHHTCSVTGCKEGFIMIDGIEKIRRPQCAAPKTAIKLAKSMPKVISCCPNTPQIGNQSRKPSKYCSEHQHLNTKQTEDSEQLTEPKINENGKRPNEDQHDPATKKVPPIVIRLPEMEGMNPEIISTELPENDDATLLVGCRKHTNVQKYYNRTAGILAAVKPCGIIVQHTDMYTCESPTQAFIMILRTYGGNDRDLKLLRYLGYDRACDLHPFLINLAKKGNPGAQLLLDNVMFLVDTFHCIRHKEKCCMPLENNPHCLYHPKLPKFKEIHHANTECAEQAFNWLARYKYSTHLMSKGRFQFFIKRIIDKRNNDTIRRLTEKGHM